MGVVLAESNVHEREFVEALNELTVLRGWTAEYALKMALRTGLEREIDVARRRKKVDEALARIDDLPDLAPGLTDKDMYDEDGSPNL